MSDHFRGKRELLIEAALGTFEQAFPLSEFQALDGVDQLLEMISAEIGKPEALDPVLTRVSMEAMNEAEPDPQMRRRMLSIARAVSGRPEAEGWSSATDRDQRAARPRRPARRRDRAGRESAERR